MNLTDKDDILKYIADLQKSPWYLADKGGPCHAMYLVRREAVEIVRDMCVNVAPTIDAIPVTWLEEIASTMRKSSSRAAADMLMGVIRLWQKEQEASM